MSNSKVEFANTLADTVFVGMNACERYGMTWGCDTDCPVLRDGKCELKDNENKGIWEQIQNENGN
mgnify:CR=1 FL=1